MESKCNMIQSKVITAIGFTRELYTRVQCKEDDVPEEFEGTVAKEFVILTISTDYFRYIGTDKVTAKFKKSLLEAMHCKELDDEETPDYFQFNSTKPLLKALPRLSSRSTGKTREYDSQSTWLTPRRHGTDRCQQIANSMMQFQKEYKKTNTPNC
jgi:hypothetical protein